jgi:hypothetical protein
MWLVTISRGEVAATVEDLSKPSMASQMVRRIWRLLWCTGTRRPPVKRRRQRWPSSSASLTRSRSSCLASLSYQGGVQRGKAPSGGGCAGLPAAGGGCPPAFLPTKTPLGRAGGQGNALFETAPSRRAGCHIPLRDRRPTCYHEDAMPHPSRPGPRKGRVQGGNPPLAGVAQACPAQAGGVPLHLFLEQHPWAGRWARRRPRRRRAVPPPERRAQRPSATVNQPNLPFPNLQTKNFSQTITIRAPIP